MNKVDIINSILSKDAGKLTEAKAAIKEMLSARESQFRADASKFVARSLFESEDPVSKHKAAAEYHKKESETETDDNMRKLHASAARVHARAASAHEQGSSDRKLISKQAERHTKRAEFIGGVLNAHGHFRMTESLSLDEETGADSKSHAWMTAYHNRVADFHARRGESDRQSLHKTAANAHASAYAAHKNGDSNKHEISANADKHSEAAEDATWSHMKSFN